MRQVGRIDRLFKNKFRQQWGHLVTEEWKVYFWHSDHVQDGTVLEMHNIVEFEAGPPNFGGLRPQAIDIRLVKREPDAEHFGKLARFVRENTEGDAA